MEVSFEKATAGELELLIGFMRQLREDDPDEGPFNESNARAATPALIADPSLGGIWIVRREGQAVGYVALTLDWSLELGGRVAFVDELFVARPFRRQGIGKATLEFVAEQARKLGVKVLLLEVTRSNDVAKGLYGRCGFVDRGHHLLKKAL